MIKIKRLIDPYPRFSFMVLAERASYESPDEKKKLKKNIFASDFIQSPTT